MPNQIEPEPDISAEGSMDARNEANATRRRQMKDPTVRFAMETLVEQIEESGQRFYEALMAVDKSGDGTLSMEELDKGLQGIDVNLETADLKAVFNVCDEDGGGTVDMNEVPST